MNSLLTKEKMRLSPPPTRLNPKQYENAECRKCKAFFYFLSSKRPQVKLWAHRLALLDPFRCVLRKHPLAMLVLLYFFSSSTYKGLYKMLNPLLSYIVPQSGMIVKEGLNNRPCSIYMSDLKHQSLELKQFTQTKLKPKMIRSLVVEIKDSTISFEQLDAMLSSFNVKIINFYGQAEAHELKTVN